MTLEAAYGRCSELTRRHGTTFFLASRLLPPDRRRHVHALYAFARTVDDLVDEPAHGSDPATELSAYADRWFAAIGGARPLGDTSPDPVFDPGFDPVVAAAADTVRRFDIAPACFERFFASMRRDLDTTAYETWDDLLGYMDGSAAAIGEMLLPLLGPSDPAAALTPARSLGLAFQLTNFLRDVGDDLDRGRQYVPQADQRRFGVDLADRRVDEPFVSLLRFEIDRCRSLYAEAGAGLALLPRRVRIAIGVARSGYAAILDQIERNGYDVFTCRATVPNTKRLRLAAATSARLAR